MKMRTLSAAIVLLMSVCVALYYFGTLASHRWLPMKRAASANDAATVEKPSFGPNGLASSPLTSQGAGPFTRDREGEQRIWAEGLSTPIAFYGRVIDENGSAIAGATIDIGINDKGFSGTAYHETSNAVGAFSITGVHGLSVSVSVSKHGYYRTDKSKSIFGYAKGMSTDRPIPTQDHPAEFVLKRQGQPPALIKHRFNADLPLNGRIGIDLSSGTVTRFGDGDVNIDYVLANQPVYHTYTPYEWHIRISVAGGGLVIRDDRFAFLAPVDGYKIVDEINMPTGARDWRPQLSRGYFVKLRNGAFGRADLEIITGQNSFLAVTSYLNPTPGDRNLEFDPAKEIKVR